MWGYFPLCFLFTLARLQSIETDMYEAADMDGASPFQQFRYLSLPQLAAILAILFLLRFIWTFNKFDDIFLLTGGNAGTRTLTVNVYEQAFAISNIGAGAAVAVVIRGSAAPIHSPPSAAVMIEMGPHPGCHQQRHHGYRAYRQLTGGAKDGIKNERDDGGIKTVDRWHARYHGVGHALREIQERHIQACFQVMQEVAWPVTAEELDEGNQPDERRQSLAEG